MGLGGRGKQPVDPGYNIMPYNPCVETNEPDPQIQVDSTSSSRLLILWVFWTFGTSIGMCLGYFNMTMIPRTFIYADGSVASWVFAPVISGASIGIVVGFIQYLVLRIRIPGPNWAAWIPISVAGFSLAIGVFDWSWKPIHPQNDLLLILKSLAWGSFLGLIIGGLQGPFIAHRLPGTRWWIWLGSVTIAWALIVPLIVVGASEGLEYGLIWTLSGILHGLITGLVLVFHMRKIGKTSIA